MYWNYFYHTWKTVSSSPFANAVVFVTDAADVALPETLTCKIISKDVGEGAVAFAVSAGTDGAGLAPDSVRFIQTEALTASGIAVQKYGAIIIPASQSATEITVEAEVNGTVYAATTPITSESEVGTAVTLKTK